MRLAITSEPITAYAHTTGEFFELPAGEYVVSDSDGPRLLYVVGPDGDLVAFDPTDPAVTIESGEEDRPH